MSPPAPMPYYYGGGDYFGGGKGFGGGVYYGAL